MSSATIALYCCVFMALALNDLKCRLVPNIIIYPVAIFSLVASIFLPPPRIISFPWSVTLDGVIGGVSSFVMFLVLYLIFKGRLGGGDVKMGVLIGLAVGFPRIFAALFIGMALGGMVSAALLVFKIRRVEDTLPFGPFLATGSMVALLWGNQILKLVIGLY